MNCCHKKFLIEDFRNLKFRIFTIGYASEGESVLGVIDNGDRHLYSFVIDSFQINNNNNSTFNGTLEKIKELKISSIDAFIWTHPDTDHSTDIQELFFDYLFCGDLMGDDVQFLDKNFLKNVSFVKIPHHGSSRTHQLPQLMKKQNVTAPIAATTTFSRYNLPEKRVIRMYQSFCESVYSTSEGAHQYGCIETDFSIRDLSCNVKLSGNAQVCV